MHFKGLLSLLHGTGLVITWFLLWYTARKDGGGLLLIEFLAKVSSIFSLFSLFLSSELYTIFQPTFIRILWYQDIVKKIHTFSKDSVTKFDAAKIETEIPGLSARTAASFYHFRRSACLSVANPSSNNTSGKPDTENIHFIFLEPLSSGKF